MIPNLNEFTACDVPWCLEMSDAVHRSWWTPDDGGWLTAIVDEVRESIDGDTYSFACGPYQRPAPLAELRSGAVKPWRDRALFGAPICSACQADADLDDDLSDMSIADDLSEAPDLDDRGAP